MTRLDRAALVVLTVLCEGAILLAVVGLLLAGAAGLSGCDTIAYCSPKGFLAGACPKFNDPPDGGP